MNAYVKEAAITAAMARELMVMQSLERRGLAQLILVVAGFTKPEVTRYVDRAIENERMRRVALANKITTL